MSAMAAAAGRLLHRALGPPQGTPLTRAPLGDRQRVAVVLQGASLLSHLRRAGWRLSGDLAAGWVCDGELLCGLAAAPGKMKECGAPLRALLATLFASGAEVGRGDGRRAARELRARWGAELVPVHPDAAV